MEFTFVKQRPLKQLYLKYIIVFIIIAACIFGTYRLTGHTFILSKDALNQHLPLLASYRQALVHFLHHPGKFTFWSWKMGLGTDTFQVYSYYTIGDVFAYLALLFPAAKITLAYQVINMIRMFCVGLAFVYFASHFRFRDNVILAGTVTYLVNAFLLYASVAQPFFTTPFILFPLIVVQIERILQGGSSWPLVGAFTWMLVSNYYFTFVLGIGSLVYLILRVLTRYRTTLNYWQAFGKLLFATVTSLLLSAVMLVPELLAVMNSTRTGSQFANGLKVYPLYYYLFLPKQLINGGQWSFMFWTALGIVSIGFLALVYIYCRPKEYPLLTIALGISFVMLLIPACGAFFNGMMSASNRWTLLAYLPLAMTVCILVENANRLTRRDLWIMSIATGIYLLVLVATYYFSDDSDDMFLPVIFLLLSLMALWMVNDHPTIAFDRWLLLIILLNGGFNAIYAAFPAKGDFSKIMLSRGEYQAITAGRYGGLDQGLAKRPFYRVSTVGQNQIINNSDSSDSELGPNLDNDLTSGLHNIDSYYSLQNKYVGKFSTSLQNNQYESNIPIRQADDRSVMNNFFGVKYLFVQSNSANATKIPAGYFMDKTTPPIINYDVGQPRPNDVQSGKAQLVPTQTIRYRSRQAFPLVYWQGDYISHQRYRRLSPTEKERALAAGVVVDGSTKGMHPARLGDPVTPIKSVLVSNRLHRVNPHHLKYTDITEKYQLQFPALQNKQVAKRYRQSELHIEFSKIKYKPFSMKEQLQYDHRHLQQMAVNPGSVVNWHYSKYKYWRYHVLNGTPDKSYQLNYRSKFGTASVIQPKQSILSFFKKVTKTTLNIGYYWGKFPASLGFQPAKLGTYDLHYRVVAEKLGPHYRDQVKTIQSHRMTNVHFGRNQVRGRISTDRPGILTSSIPYSTGWRVKIDGHPAKVVRTNQAFVGVWLPTGNHRVRFYYQTPGLTLGAKVSLIGLAWLLVTALVSPLYYRHQRNCKTH